jgi:PPK2 family polyphosphate:nucleotide phosphotransferase
MNLTEDAVNRHRVSPGTKVRLADWDTKWKPPELEALNRDQMKEQSDRLVAELTQEIAEQQDILWADGRWGLLLIFQGLDGSGKDSTIKHVTSGMNPAGIHVRSFKEPSQEELRHDYLWRYVKEVPEKGIIGVFNRSYYEELVVVRVNPELLKARGTPEDTTVEKFWQRRYEDINFLEKHLVRNGTMILKFFLHISKEEQRNRLLERLEDPKKQWKWNPNDLTTRDRWADYQHAYAAAISNTSTPEAPWYIMPADRKWAMRALVARAICSAIQTLGLRYPPIDDAKGRAIDEALTRLRREGA